MTGLGSQAEEPAGPAGLNAPTVPTAPDRESLNQPVIAGQDSDGLTRRSVYVEPQRVGGSFTFRTRLTFALIAAAILPLAAFGLTLIAVIRLVPDPAATLPRLLLLAIVIAALLAILVAFILAGDLTSTLRAIVAAVERVSSGDLSTPIEVGGEDELGRLAQSHNRLAADLDRRNRELGRILAAIVAASPRDGVRFLVGQAATDARSAFGMVDARMVLADPGTVPVEERIPGEALPVRAEVRAGEDRRGVLVGHLPATRAWERADQDLLELFASEIGVAIRNAQLFERVDTQNARLLELDAAKDDFLRGVSHNLQTPLASIRAYADRLQAERADPRLGIIVEQTDRLSRMVRQLLTVSRLGAGTLHPTAEVLALAPRVRRAWDALGASEVAFSVRDEANGWLAVADGDQLDQVLWALLDNAVKYGGRVPISAVVTVDVPAARLRLAIADGGPGVPDKDRDRLFARFVRGTAGTAMDGSGLGLYVSRELARAMDGDLVLEPEQPGRGAVFTVILPAEPGLET